MMRKSFWDIFRENPDGSLTPTKAISVNGISFGTQATFGPGVSISGLDFHLFRNLDVAVEEKDGTLVLKGFYK
jgi:hypothetical protein